MRNLLLVIVTFINCMTILHGGCTSKSWEYWASLTCLMAAYLIGMFIK